MRLSSAAFADLLPQPRWSERHTREVAASPADALRAARSITVTEMPLARALFAVRGITRGRRELARPLWDSLIALPGFLALGETDDAVAAGLVGRPWKLSGGAPRPPVVDAESFRAFVEPGYVKAVTTLAAEPAPRGARIVTETHIAPTDAYAERMFGRYWLVVRWGSGATRRSWLAAAARRLERAG
jgi:hypothetical protein